MSVRRFMGGVQDDALFATREAAEHFAKSLGTAGSPTVVECSVFGGTAGQQEVYTASYYDRVNDIHVLEGVYGTYEAAKSAAGENGLVLNRTIQR